MASCDPWNVKVGQQGVGKIFPYVYNHDKKDIKYISSGKCLQFKIIGIGERILICFRVGENVFEGINKALNLLNFWKK